MPSFTCPHADCLKTVQYSYDKPKGCPYCLRRPEEAFAVAPSITSELRKLKKPSRPARYEEEDYEDENDYVSVDELKAKLAVEIVPEGDKKLKLIDVAMGAGGSSQGFQEKDAETALKDFKDSGRSARSNPVEIR